MAIEVPQLDPRDEDEVVADVIDGLPAEISDRNPSSIEVKLIEGLGTFYGLVLYQLNRMLIALHLVLLGLLDITPKAMVASRVTLTFTSADNSGRAIPAGTVVKTDPGVDAVKFVTDEAVTAGDAGWSGSTATISVAATAVVAGSGGNVGDGTLETLETPIAGIDSVTNQTAAYGGADEETEDELLARAPDAIMTSDRAVSKPDFESLAIDGGALRAMATGSAGAVNVYFLDDSINENPSTSLQDQIADYLEARTVPGVVVTAHQYSVRLVAFDAIELSYTPGADKTATQARIKAAIADYIDAEAWPFGQYLYYHEMISLVDRVEGVDRVGTIKYQTSDNYGTSWGPTPAQPMTHNAELEPGASAVEFRLMHYGDGFPNAPAISWTEL